MSTTQVKAPVVSFSGARLSEGVTYNPANNSLLWVDIANGEVHRVEIPKTKKEEYSESDLNTIKNSHEVVSYKEQDEQLQQLQQKHQQQQEQGKPQPEGKPQPDQQQQQQDQVDKSLSPDSINGNDNGDSSENTGDNNTAANGNTDVPSIGAIGLTRDNDIVLAAAKQGIAIVSFKALSFEYKYKFDFLSAEQRRRFRSNDAKISPAGNFWIGIMMDNLKYSDIGPEGWLVKFDHQTLKYTSLLEGQTIPNGMAWNKDLTKFFHINSTTQKIRVYDYDKTTDSIANGEDFFDASTLTDNYTEPDGMTIDDADNLYVALWESSTVFKISPQGEVVHRFVFPAKRTNCPVIGGSQLNELFVSTADLHLDEPEKVGSEKGDFGGSIFRVKLSETKGRHNYIWQGPI